MPKRFVHRHQPQMRAAGWIKAGLGGALGIAAMGLLSLWTDIPFLIAPFGASCVLLFSIPESPLSQPANVIGGHVVATALSLALYQVMPHDEWWAIAIAVGAAIFVMAVVRLSHPPAGADPIVIFLTGPSVDFLIFPVLVGALVLVGIAVLVHRVPPRIVRYPAELPTSPPSDGRGGEGNAAG
ncbi:MAG: HPP family protein [Rhodospirillales bacterium]|nr:HPP family protein [Rhodospirillales bacterium]